MIDRTFDYRRIKKALGHFPIISLGIYYLMDGDALWSFVKRDNTFYICAVVNNPITGKEAKRTAIAAFDWMFRNTDISEISAEIRKDNRKSCHMAILGGMTRDRQEGDHIYYKVSESDNIQ